MDKKCTHHQYSKQTNISKRITTTESAARFHSRPRTGPGLGGRKYTGCCNHKLTISQLPHTCSLISRKQTPPAGQWGEAEGGVKQRLHPVTILDPLSQIDFQREDGKLYETTDPVGNRQLLCCVWKCRYNASLKVDVMLIFYVGP